MAKSCIGKKTEELGARPWESCDVAVAERRDNLSLRKENKGEGGRREGGKGGGDDRVSALSGRVWLDTQNGLQALDGWINRQVPQRDRQI